MNSQQVSVNLNIHFWCEKDPQNPANHQALVFTELTEACKGMFEYLRKLTYCELPQEEERDRWCKRNVCNAGGGY